MCKSPHIQRLEDLPLTVDFLPFANDASSANVVTQAEYLAAASGSGYVQNGFSGGTAASNQANKAIRQSSVMVAALAQFIAAKLSANVLDSGGSASVTALQAQFLAAIQAGPTFTGTPAAPTAAAGTNTTQLATTAFTTDAVATAKVSPALTGTPTAPTAGAGTNTTQLATTAFVTSAVAALLPSGTASVFYQAAAPTGWTKVTTHNDKALRVVSGTGGGSGGSTAFSTVFSARTISTANMPVHSHGVTDPGHSHTTSPLSYNGNSANSSGSAYPTNTGSMSTSTNTTGITIQNSGSGTSMDFAVQYIDVIIATKN